MMSASEVLAEIEIIDLEEVGGHPHDKIVGQIRESVNNSWSMLSFNYCIFKPIHKPILIELIYIVFILIYIHIYTSIYIILIIILYIIISIILQLFLRVFI